MAGGLERFRALNFEAFRQLALDDALSDHERIGFPDSYRAGFDQAIVGDIFGKLPVLLESGKIVFDIGPGCSEVPRSIMAECARRGNELVLIDSAEMLGRLPSHDSIRKVSGRFPDCMSELVSYRGRVDAVICYSVLHYALVDVAFFRFVDSMFALLAPGGSCLIGDIPNLSMRKRFFSSETGIAFHKRFMQTQDAPLVSTYEIADDLIDDAVVLSVMMRARAAGFHAYVLPQPATLPMANRREDLLITRP